MKFDMLVPVVITVLGAVVAGVAAILFIPLVLSFRMAAGEQVLPRDRWAERPIMALCEDAPPIWEEYIVQLLQELDEDVLVLSGGCGPPFGRGIVRVHGPLDGSGLVDHVLLPQGRLGVTLLEREFGQITTADIYIRSEAAHDPLVLQHELGHALGWGHVPEKGHLMFPAREGMGGDTTGME